MDKLKACHSLADKSDDYQARGSLIPLISHDCFPAHALACSQQAAQLGSAVVSRPAHQWGVAAAALIHAGAHPCLA